MQFFLETLAALLAGAGLFILGWLLVGRLLTPVGAQAPAFAMLPVRGDAGSLEHDVRGLLWMRGSDLARITIVIVDCGLSEEGRAAALLLQRREPAVLVCPVAQIGALLADGKETVQTV